MSDPEPPARPRPARPAHVLQPFRWLVRSHLLSAGGDALIAIALAGSLFFDLDPASARPKVALYLVVTMAPFAVVGPLIGPLIDRSPGGRRAMIVGTAAGRAVVALLMVRDLDSLFLFPEAFAVLVLGKTYQVAKAAVVPGMVRHDSELVEANSKLVLVAGIGGALAVGPGVALHLVGSRWVLVLATLVFAVMVLPASRLRSSTPPPRGRAGRDERAELRGGRILLAASAMAVLRAMTGFTLFLVAFWLRGDDAHPAWFGLMVGASGIGAVLGALLAPAVRHRVNEEVLLTTSLGLAGAVAVFAAAIGGRAAVALLIGAIGMAASTGKLSFDAIAQRDAPSANYGRAFAQFETRFQLSWVLGAFIPVVTPIGILPVRAGLVTVAVAAVAGMFLYLGGLWASARGRRTPGQVILDRAVPKRLKRRRRRGRRDPDRRSRPAPPSV
ncbi:MAG TPA: hypothetical protein DEP66_03370 [Acidimicrobiaceae bacterium]|nr:hypothetical protein [Acidimicrobiaceae bacterium]